jgi:carbon-monoxide dehydrogenase small subunit
MKARSSLTVDGTAIDLAEVPDDERLLDTLRWRLDLKGTKEGCRSGGCGACTVLADDRAILSCLTLTHELEGSRVLTIEKIDEDPVGRRVALAFERESAVQCGYCTPGFVMAVTGLLKEADGKEALPDLLSELHGNLCRCTGYASIVRAVERAAERRP